MILFANNATEPRKLVRVESGLLALDKDDSDKNCVHDGIKTSLALAEHMQKISENHSDHNPAGIPKPKRRRRVHFGQELQEHVVVLDTQPSSEMTTKEKSQLYHSPAELELIKMTARMFAKDALNQDAHDPRPQSYSRVLGRVYDDCCDNTGSRVYDASTGTSDEDDYWSDSSEEQESGSTIERDMLLLKRWNTHSKCRRGLERYIAPQVASQRKELIRITVWTILRSQARLDKKEYLSADSKAEYLSKISQACSRPSTEFAQRMAQADEAVAESIANESCIKCVEV